eukprot:SAG22_NODE_305_length_12688_cov_24.723330_2_plen_504_part_00
MGIREMLEPIIRLILFVAYGVYVLCGVFLLVAGVYYFAQITGANDFAAAVCCGAGATMLLLGGLGMFANLNRNGNLLFVKFVLDLVLFVALVGALMVSMAILNEVSDPVSKAVYEAYCDEPNLDSDYCVRPGGWKPDNVGLIFRVSMWPAIVKLFGNGAPAQCDAFNTGLIAQELAGDSTVDASASWQSIGGTVVLGTCTSVDDCTVDSEAAGNCTFILETQGPGRYAQCKSCWHAWQEFKIDKAKEHIWPATYSVWGLFGFMIILVALNVIMLEQQPGEDETKWKPVGTLSRITLGVNGLVFIFGALVMGLGIYAHTELSDNCPLTKECNNWAVVGIIVIGIFFMLTCLFSIVGLVIGSIIGKMMVRITDLVFLVLGFWLMVFGIGFTIVAGGMNDINTTYDDNFSDIRDQYDQQFPGLCDGLDDPQCRAVIKSKVEGAIQIVAIVVGGVVFAMVFFIFLTYQAFHIYRGAVGGDSDELDEDEDEAEAEDGGGGEEDEEDED